MNELFILTQDMTIVGLEHIMTIGLLGGTVTNDKTGKTDDAIAVTAALDQEYTEGETDIDLGYYLSDEKANEVMEELVSWLNEKNEYRRVFRMPPSDIEERDY